MEKAKINMNFSIGNQLLNINRKLKRAKIKKRCLFLIITPLSHSFYINLTINELKSTKTSILLSQSPTLIFGNIKSSFSAIQLSKFYISKSNSHLLYSNNNFNKIVLNILRIYLFLTQPIFIDQFEIFECNFTIKDFYDYHASINLNDCYFQDCISQSFFYKSFVLYINREN